MFEDHYSDHVYDYMSDLHFMTKWGVVSFWIHQYCSAPNRILDLGCGQTTAVDFLKPSEIDYYIGIDALSRVSRRSSVLAGNIEEFDVSSLKKTFNCLLWLGIESLPEKYPLILKKFLSVIEYNGLVVFDYMPFPPESIFERIGIQPLRHLTGCRLLLPYVPENKRQTWPRVNERIMEAFIKL